VVPSIPSSDESGYSAVGMKERGGLRLLIVEDSAPVRRLIKSVVGELADVIYECVDGADALSDYISHRPDFVLMDIQMKLVDGIMATRQITAADPAAQIIIVTDYDQADLREAAKDAGAIGYVVKDNLLDLVSFLRAHGDAGRDLHQP
jgi:CheY-like chemotaxis protein